MAVGYPASALQSSAVQMIPCDSDAIAAYGYDPEKWKLFILPRKRASQVYIYDGFPPDKYEDFLAAGSKGSYWNRVVKENYQLAPR